MVVILLLLAPQIVTREIPPAQVGEEYEVVIRVRGGRKPLRWHTEGLPPGLSIKGGKISGRPASAGRFVFIVEVRDADGESDSAILVLRVKPKKKVVLKKEKPVEAALMWLARHQDRRHLGGEEGRFDPAGFMRNCRDTACSNPPRVQEGFTVGVTSLATLPFLNAGSTHKKGRFSSTVAAAVKWLLQKQSSDGWFGKKEKGGLWYVRGWLYNHALTTMLLCRLFKITKDEDLRRRCERALRCLIAAQKENSGWGYEWEEANIVLSAFCGLALAEAKEAGFKFPDSVFEGLARLAAVCQRKDGHFSYTKTRKGEGLGPTASGVIISILAGVEPDEKSKKLLESYRPVKRIKDMTECWLVLVALRMLGRGGEVARAVKGVVSATQEKEGCRRGSWEPEDRWGETAGRIYTTAMAALILQECEKFK